MLKAKASSPANKHPAAAAFVLFTLGGIALVAWLLPGKSTHRPGPIEVGIRQAAEPLIEVSGAAADRCQFHLKYASSGPQAWLSCTHPRSMENAVARALAAQGWSLVADGRSDAARWYRNPHLASSSCPASARSSTCSLSVHYAPSRQ